MLRLFNQWFCGILGLYKSMENPGKVEAKIGELNRQEPKPKTSIGFPLHTPLVWKAVPGYFALTGFNYGQGNPQFNPSYGYPVKVFVNERTGEMRIFPASLFEN